MSLPIEREVERLHELLAKPDVREAMRMRCEQDRHDWENGMTPLFQVIRICSWCGERRG